MSAGTARDKSHWKGIYIPQLECMCFNWQGRYITYKSQQSLNISSIYLLVSNA